MPNPTRIHGLDLLRSSAILLVLMYHYMCYVSQTPTFGFFSSIGWMGVDLFFVLSGYLIGHQIFASVKNQAGFSFKIFYVRRLLRTLPNYWFVLALYFLIPCFRELPDLPSLWKFLTFTQNIHLQAGTAFSQAWSLCIEEQFYLVLPIVVMLVVAQKSIRMGWSILIALFIAGMIWRSYLWLYMLQGVGSEFANLYSSLIYYSSFCRLDELLFGIAIAMLRHYHHSIWETCMVKGNHLLGFGLFMSVFTMMLFLHDQYSLLMTAFGYPLLAISFSSLTLAAISPSSLLHRLHVPVASILARWSYAIYLIHKPLMVLTHDKLLQYHIPTSPPLAILIEFTVVMIGSWLLYTFIETPFLKLRDGITQPLILPKIAVSVLK